MSRASLTVLLLGLGLAAGAAEAAPLETTGASQCRTRGYSIDTDPKGTNLRSAPRADAPIIGHLGPAKSVGPGSKMVEGVEFQIVGAKDGWLLIRKGEPDDEVTLDLAHQADGRGWVSGRLVGTSLSRQEFRSAPRRDAPIIAQMRGPDWGPDSAQVSAVHACSDKYVEVTATPYGGKPIRGWSWEPCSNQLTTCDPAGESE